jgi:hypothetical protein
MEFVLTKKYGYVLLTAAAIYYHQQIFVNNLKTHSLQNYSAEIEKNKLKEDSLLHIKQLTQRNTYHAWLKYSACEYGSEYLTNHGAALIPSLLCIFMSFSRGSDNAQNDNIIWSSQPGIALHLQRGLLQHNIL